MDIAIQLKTLEEQLLALQPHQFEEFALIVFRFQAQYNPLYQRFLELLSVQPNRVEQLSEIPFLPISFFKQHVIKTGAWQTQQIFTSSGTTGQLTSKHHIKTLEFYLQNARLGFESTYGKPENYCFLALLPSYLERTGSSLIAMVDDFIKASNYPQSGFFLYNFDALAQQLQDCIKAQIPTILIGVSFALLDFAELYPMDLSAITIMETGGMKGRRKEMIRKELHEHLQNAFQTTTIHSEYGMTELLSQAYSKTDERFVPAATMQVLMSDITDPRSFLPYGRTGKINILDLANLHTCSFLATDDIGKRWQDGSFEILGRTDFSDVRGCNLMVEL
jgi:phenylacetate-coenzyme A ligase PaaK-like adenylate-forming protein